MSFLMLLLVYILDVSDDNNIKGGKENEKSINAKYASIFHESMKSEITIDNTTKHSDAGKTRALTMGQYDTQTHQDSSHDRKKEDPSSHHQLDSDSNTRYRLAAIRCRFLLLNCHRLYRAHPIIEWQKSLNKKLNQPSAPFTDQELEALDEIGSRHSFVS